MSDVVLEERRDGVALLTLNRPDRLNAWSPDMAAAYEERLLAAEDDADVRVVVLTGAGRGFCAGADMGSLRQIGGSPPPADRESLGGGAATPLRMRTPVIAAVNGAAAGLGFAITLMCDLRFAAAGAKLTTAFARLGLAAEYGVSWLLPRLVGQGNALDLLLSARIVTAEEAHAMGLVNRVIAPDALLDETLAYARLLAETVSPASMATLKAQVRADAANDLTTALAEADRLQLAALRGDDFREGVAAFVERRPPRFPGLGPGGG